MGLKIGVYDLWINGGGGGEKKALVLADHLSRKHDVWLITGEEPNKPALEAYFGVDLSRVKSLVLRRPLLNRLHSLGRGGSARNLLETIDRLGESALFSQMQALHLDAFLNCQWASLLPNPARYGIYMCMFPNAMKGAAPFQLSRGWLVNQLLGMRADVLSSYSSITANSAFTSDWIQQLWRVPSSEVYSSCEPMGPALPKEKIIVHVGRFVGPGRADDKHQGTMLNAFLQMKGLHHDGWQLHFAGTIIRGDDAKQRADSFVEAARGYPVRFHFGKFFDELRDLYRRASIYWHATGFGLSSNTNPESQEHFGQTTVEAMSAGAVPVVINTGGLREIVTHGVDGLLWDNLDGLTKHTQRLAEDSALRLSLSQAAEKSSARFSRHAFGERIEHMIEAGVR